MERRAKVIVVDDQNIARGFFEMHVKASQDFELVGSLPAADKAVAFCDSNEVDLVVMDIMMRYGVDGLTAAEIIKRRHPDIKMILVTSMAEAGWEKKAREIGVESFWYKEYSEEPLIEIMERTIKGENVYPGSSPSVKFGLINSSELTDRELDVLRELTRGATNEEIAESLSISIHTVKRHIQNLIEKTGYDSRLALAVHAKELGIVVSDNERKKSEVQHEEIF